MDKCKKHNFMIIGTGFTNCYITDVDVCCSKCHKVASLTIESDLEEVHDRILYCACNNKPLKFNNKHKKNIIIRKEFL